jgi:hypothetical protein
VVSCGGEGSPAFRDRGLLAGWHVDAVRERGRELGLAHAGNGERLVGQEKLVRVGARLNRQDAAAAPVALIDGAHRAGIAALRALQQRAEIGAGEGVGQGRAGAGPGGAGVELLERGRQRGKARRGSRLELVWFRGQKQPRRLFERGRGRARKRRAIDAVELGRDVRLGQPVVRAVSDPIGEDLLVVSGALKNCAFPPEPSRSQTSSNGAEPLRLWARQ